jgi:hypothetical protein
MGNPRSTSGDSVFHCFLDEPGLSLHFPQLLPSSNTLLTRKLTVQRPPITPNFPVDPALGTHSVAGELFGRFETM